MTLIVSNLFIEALPRYLFSCTHGPKSDRPCPICVVPKGLLSSINLHFEAHPWSKAMKVIQSALEEKDKNFGDEMCKAEGFHKVEVLVHF